MARSRELRIPISGDPRSFNRALGSMEARLGRTESHLHRFGKVGGAALASLGVAAGGAAVLGIKKTIDAASDLNEQLSKNSVVFKGSAKDIEAWSKTTATSIGLSQRQALEATGTLGNMLIPMGVARDKAAEMSKSMVNLAGDLASFNNASPQDVLEALRSGLSGESEPMRRFGVDLRDAALEQFRLNEHIKVSVKDMDSGSKQRLIYNKIINDTTDAQGDYIRTASSLPNLQRTIQAQFEDTAQTVGQSFLPAARSVATVVSKEVMPALQKLGTELGGIAGRKDIDLGQKITLGKASVNKNLGPFAKQVGAVIDRADIPDKLGRAFELAAPKIADAMAASAPRAAGSFVRAFQGAGIWGQLLTAGFLVKKLGGFKAAGTAAGATMGTAAAGSAAAKLRGFGWAALGASIGLAIGAPLAAQLGKSIGQTITKLTTRDDALGDIARKLFGGAGPGTYIGDLVPDTIPKNRNPIGTLADTLSNLPGLSKTPPRPKSSSVFSGAPGFDMQTGAFTAGSGAGGSGRSNASRIYPLGVRGKVIGTPFAGTHRQGDWQSDRAVDIQVKRGTPVLAIEAGTIVKVKVRPDQGGQFSGSQITLKSKRNQYFYTHLSDVAVGAGQKVNAGDVIGYSGTANGVQHLHVAEQRGDANALGKLRADASVGELPLSPRQKVIERAAKAAGIDPAILYGVYGQESNFGKNLGPSSAGALGPFQIMPGTARELGLKGNDVMDFEKAARAAAKYLARYKSRGTKGMLGAYNAGPAGDPNNAETRNYIEKVLGYARQFPTAQGTGGLDFAPTDFAEVIRIISQKLASPIVNRLNARQGVLNRGIRGSESAVAGIIDPQIGLAERRGQVPGANIVGLGRTIATLQRTKAWALQSRVPLLQGKIANYRKAIRDLRKRMRSTAAPIRKQLASRVKHYQNLIAQTKRDLAALGIEIEDAQIDVELADAAATEAAGDTAGITNANIQRDLGMADALLGAGRIDQGTRDEGVKRIIGQALGGQYGVLSLQDRLGLEAQLGQIGGDAPSGNAAAVAAAINRVNLEERAGGLSATDAEARRKQIRESALEGGFGQLTPDDWLQIKGDLKEAADQAQSQSQTLEDINRKLGEQNDLLRQAKEEALRKYNVSQSQYPTIMRALAAAVSGELGGKIGLGFASVGYPGAGASY